MMLDEAASVEATYDVTVVIPCKDVVGTIEDQLSALAAQDFTGAMDILLCDNGSTDGLPACIEAWRERYSLALRHVDASGRAGVSHARNVGLRAATTDVVAVCDADDMVSPAWISALLEGVQGGCSVVGGAIDVTTLNDETRQAWRPGPPMDRLPEKLGFKPYAIGANLAVRRDDALSVGGWDEDYVAGGDDVDFAWRIQLAGHRIGFAPDALVHYRYRADLRGTARQARAYARCEARLLAQYADRGASPYRPSRTRIELSWLRHNLRDLFRSEASRGRWIYKASTVAGRLGGAVRVRRWVG